MEQLLRNAAALSEDGYIISQRVLKGVPFGHYTSARNGCGWIAAYNFLKINGLTRPAEEVHEAFHRTLSFGGLFGVMPFFLGKYLKRFLPVKGGIFCARSVLPKIDSGILLYKHPKDFHYVAFYKTGETFRFLNVKGTECREASIKDFLTREGAWRTFHIFYL